MWNEKARPSRIDDIAGNPDLKSDILSWQQNGAPAALLFVGPPGTGKTTTARVIANMMLGDEMHVNYEETNGSDDRGISFIREDLKTFLRVKPVGVDRKVILIDEADGLTTQAQDAMRQLIENYSHNALIIMTANEMEKIRPAIRSSRSLREHFSFWAPPNPKISPCMQSPSPQRNRPAAGFLRTFRTP